MNPDVDKKAEPSPVKPSSKTLVDEVEPMPHLKRKLKPHLRKKMPIFVKLIQVTIEMLLLNLKMTRILPILTQTQLCWSRWDATSNWREGRTGMVLRKLYLSKQMSIMMYHIKPRKLMKLLKKMLEVLKDKFLRMKQCRILRTLEMLCASFNSSSNSPEPLQSPCR